MRIIDNELLDKLSEQAVSNERLRKNYNLHNSLNDHVQRLLNALEPGTKLPIHRHTHTDETYMVIKGSLNVLLYNENKNLTQTIHLDPKIGKFGISIPASKWHSLEVLEKGTVIFEVKQGPYSPLEKIDIMEL